MPEDWPALFVQHLNAGELERVVALYEPEARFVSESGETAVGRERIRSVLEEMIELKTHLQSRVMKAIAIDDIALLYTDFQGTRLDSSGNAVAAHYKAVEVLRRQADGTWQLIVGDPTGRG